MSLQNRSRSGARVAFAAAFAALVALTTWIALRREGAPAPGDVPLGADRPLANADQPIDDATGNLRTVEVDPAVPTADGSEQRPIDDGAADPVAAVQGVPDAPGADGDPVPAGKQFELQYSCGRIYAGTPIDHVFPLRNDTDTQLRVLRTMPSIRCRMQFDRVVAPGTEGRFEVRLDTSQLKPGPFKLVVRVQTANKVADGNIVIEGEIVAPGEPLSPRR